MPNNDSITKSIASCNERSDDPLVGRAVAHFKVRDSLGAGGMGKVYLALDMRLGRQVALKMLAPEYTQDADRLRRFESFR